MNRRIRRRSPALLALLTATLGIVAISVTTGGTFGGFTAQIANSSNSIGTAPYFTCAQVATADKSTALFQLPLNESAGAITAADTSGNSNTGTYQGTMTTSTTTPLACSRDGGSAYVLNGTSSYVSTNEAKQTDPTTFSIEVWFKTTVASGKLIGFGSSQTGASSSYDRHIYLTTAGKLTFGIYNSGYYTITSPNAYTDGSWHQVIATLAPTGAANPGMTLYVDGKQVAVNTSYVTPQNFAGWWRIGYDAQGSWAGAGTNPYFTGSIRYAATYTSTLTPTQVLNEWAAGQ